MASRLACACGPPLKAPGVCPASAAMSLVQPPLRASQRESHLSTSPLDLEHDLAAVLVLDLHRDHAGPPFATFLFETWLVLVLLLSGLHSGPWCQFSIVDLAPWPFQLLASQQPPHSPSLPQAGWLLSQRGGGPLLVCRNRRQGAIRSLNQTMNAALRPAGREGQRGAGGLLRAGPGRQVTRFVCLAGQEGELGPPGDSLLQSCGAVTGLGVLGPRPRGLRIGKPFPSVALAMIFLVLVLLAAGVSSTRGGTGGHLARVALPSGSKRDRQRLQQMRDAATG